MDMNIRNIDPALVRQFRAKAIAEGYTLKEKITFLMKCDLENKATSQPINREDKKK